jgi:hypothetical protein
MAGFWASKPPPGRPLDPAHPFVKGAAGVWIPQEGDGGVIDLTRQQDQGSYNGVAVAGIAGRLGKAWYSPGATTDYISVPDDVLLNPTGDITLWIWALPSVLPSAFKSVMMKATGSSSDLRQFGIGITSGNLWRGVWYANNAETALSATSFGTISLTEPALVVTTRSKEGATRIYVNGQLINASTMITNPLHVLVCPLVWCRLGNSASEAYNGFIGASGISSTVVSEQAVRDFYARPWDIFQSPAWRKLYVPQAAAPGGYTPRLSLLGVG